MPTSGYFPSQGTRTVLAVANVMLGASHHTLLGALGGVKHPLALQQFAYIFEDRVYTILREAQLP